MTSMFQKPSVLPFILKNGGWDKSPSLSIVFGLSSKTQWLSGLYYADFISFYSPTQLCGGGTTKSNSNELPISVPLSLNTNLAFFFSLPCNKHSKSSLTNIFIFLITNHNIDNSSFSTWMNTNS